MLDFTPYNYYVLYGGIILFLVFLTVFLVKTLGCLKKISEVTPSLEHIQTNIKTTKDKTTALQRKANSVTPMIKKVITIVPILWAIQTAYKQQEEKGFSGYRKAAVNTISKKQTKSMLQSYMKGLF